MAKVLVVEDDAAIAELLRMHFAERGHQVLVAQDGLAGPMLAAREKPELVILDFNMPAANGGKVLERLRGSTFTAATPVIFVTASPVAEIMSQVPDDPRVRFMQKPVDFALLTRLTAELMGGAPAPAEPGAPPPPAADGPLSLD
ncbi:MAG: response regulator [Elusimicrobiota bacterium]|nr:response regulator [Elusimicrobiota bacterium]